MKKINVTYYNNFEYDFNKYKELYKECNELNDEEIAEVDDDVIYDFIYDELQIQLDDFFSNLEFSKFSNIPCVVFGSVRVWSGTREVAPTIFSDLASAIRKCINNMEYCIIKQVRGYLEVTGIHPDGRNTFEIHLLNDKGVDAMCRIEDGYSNVNLSNKYYHKAISGYLI